MLIEKYKKETLVILRVSRQGNFVKRVNIWRIRTELIIDITWF